MRRNPPYEEHSRIREQAAFMEVLHGRRVVFCSSNDSDWENYFWSVMSQSESWCRMNQRGGPESGPKLRFYLSVKGDH